MNCSFLKIKISKDFGTLVIDGMLHFCSDFSLKATYGSDILVVEVPETEKELCQISLLMFQLK
jgi:hypothetical protein